MAKTPSKGTAAIQRLLDERKQLESWIARIDAAADATPAAVRGRVRSDYETRLITVIKELKNHMEAAREVIAQRRQVLADLQEKEGAAAEALSEAELRHAVGEYDEGQWTQVHKEALSELVSIREELQVVQAEVEKLQEIDALAAESAPPKPAPRPAPPPPPPLAEPSLTVVSDRGKTTSPPPSRPQPRGEEKKHEPVDELAFLKSVTEDARGGGGVTPAGERRAIPARGARRSPGSSRASVAASHDHAGAPDHAGNGSGHCRVRRGAGEDPEVPGLRNDEPADGVVLRELRGGARRHVRKRRQEANRRETNRRETRRSLTLCFSTYCFSTPLFFGTDERRQPGFLSRRVVLMDQALPGSPVEQLHGAAVGGGGGGLVGGGADALQRGPELGVLSAIDEGAGAGLAQRFLGGLDFRHEVSCSRRGK